MTIRTIPSGVIYGTTGAAHSSRDYNQRNKQKRLQEFESQEKKLLTNLGNWRDRPGRGKRNCNESEEDSSESGQAVASILASMGGSGKGKGGKGGKDKGGPKSRSASKETRAPASSSKKKKSTIEASSSKKRRVTPENEEDEDDSDIDDGGGLSRSQKARLKSVFTAQCFLTTWIVDNETPPFNDKLPQVQIKLMYDMKLTREEAGFNWHSKSTLYEDDDSVEKALLEKIEKARH